MAVSEGPPEAKASARAAPPRRKLVLAGLCALALVVLLVLLGADLARYASRFAAWVGELGAWGPAVFVLGYALATVAFVPGSLLTLAAGALFGIVPGALYVLAGATLGSAAAFLIARHLARAWVERRTATDPRFAAVDRAIGEEGRKIVLLLRLSPVFPYNLLNYALGLTRVRFRDYLVASLGMLPGILLYVYSGRVIGDLALLAAGAEVPRGAGYYVVLGVGLAATVLVTVLITRRARRALREATEPRLPQAPETSAQSGSY
jgi:uncharacterized membrane protein YdjX (TVP38/TMEM64 family)